MPRNHEHAPACGGAPNCVSCREHARHLKFERSLARDASSERAAMEARRLRELRESRRLGFSRRQVLILGTILLASVVGCSMLAHSEAPTAQVVTK